MAGGSKRCMCLSAQNRTYPAPASYHKTQLFPLLHIFNDHLQLSVFILLKIVLVYNVPWRGVPCCRGMCSNMLFAYPHPTKIPQYTNNYSLILGN